MIAPSERLFRTFLMLALACSCSSRLAHAEDYLTPDEVEQLREAQEPHLRLKVFEDLLESRLNKAKSLKDPASVKTKAPEPKPDKKQKSDKGAVAVPAEKTTALTESKPFVSWMTEYLQCLEELGNNVENFSTTPLEPKAYLKSLNKLQNTLGEHSQWINQTVGQLDKPEKKVVTEISDALKELSENINEAKEKAQEQIKLLKETEKARSSRKR